MMLPTAGGRARGIGRVLATIGLAAGVAGGARLERVAGGGRGAAAQTAGGSAAEVTATLVAATVAAPARAGETAVTARARAGETAVTARARAGETAVAARPGVRVAGSPTLAITATAAPGSVEFGATAAVLGAVRDPAGGGVAGEVVALERDQYPFTGYRGIGHATTVADGSFDFAGLTPDRDTRYEVLDAATPDVVSPAVTVVVDTPVVTRIATLAHGEVTVTATATHSRAFDWNHRAVRWYVRATGSHGASTLVARTLTREVRAGTTRLSATFYPPSGPFTYLACFTAGGTRGLGVADAASRCEVTGTAIGHPSPAVPSATEIAAAERFLDERDGRTGFAVVDSHGRLSGVRLHERFHSASLIKAMLLVAYLRMVGDEHRDLTEDDREILEPMIHVSDNDAASAVFGVVGEAGLTKLAAVAGMGDFAPSPAWGLSEISPADQAVFFAEQDSLIPARFVSYARSLLSGIDPSQRWGIPAGVAGRYKVFFKGGWLPDMGIVNQAARLEGDGRTIALSILTSDGPGMGYGEATLEGTTRRLLG